MKDSIYTSINPNIGEIPHKYGKNVHLLYDPVSLCQLADLCQASTIQPTINDLVRELYQYIIREVVKKEFPTQEISVKTRMHQSHPKGIWQGVVTQKNTKTVTVNVMRAGSLPSQICFDFFNRTLNPEGNRQDHVIMSRTVDQNEEVTGAKVHGSKIGGDINDAIVLFPDPMGATGSSLSKILDFYSQEVQGTPKKWIAIHLIVTPEYLKKITTLHPNVKVYALRLDRGCSDPKVFNKLPGELWDQESGLNDKHYIIPGGGGFGELINNSFC